MQRLELLPMFATPGTMPSGPGWAYEVKWDGVRAISTVSGGALRIVGRNGRDITARYPELQGLAETFGAREAVLDGEIIAYDDNGLPSFERLQARMHVDEPVALGVLMRSTPVVYMIFDFLAFDGEVLATLPYAQRRARLEALALDGPAWHVPPNEVGDGSTIEAFTRQHAIEGIVAKRLDSRYEPGRHSPAWRKIKHTRRQEFVVGGWTPGERGRAGDIGALVLGVYEHDASGASQLRCCGRVGSGFSQDTLIELRRVLAPLARESSPFDVGSVPRHTNFVEPRLVAEVRFAQWTTAHVVRAAVFLGLRTDKDPRAVTREA